MYGTPGVSEKLHRLLYFFSILSKLQQILMFISISINQSINYLQK